MHQGSSLETDSERFTSGYLNMCLGRKKHTSQPNDTAWEKPVQILVVCINTHLNTCKQKRH